MKEFLSTTGIYVGIFLVGLLSIFAGFKCSQSVGRMRRNDLETYWGEGSFLSFLIAPLVIAFWAIVAITCLFFTFGLISKLIDDVASTNDQKNSDLQTKQELQSTKEKTLRYVEQTTLMKSEDHSIAPKESVTEASKDQAWTTEEIRQMEAEKQYSGNDPIVRARLGLPPKADQ
jgi:hypothetical protein